MQMQSRDCMACAILYTPSETEFKFQATKQKLKIWQNIDV